VGARAATCNSSFTGRLIVQTYYATVEEVSLV
jgi:hypothetical protein